MKRLGVVLSSAVVWLFLLATQALAQYPPSRPPASPGHGTNGTNGTGTAFTGANISFGVIILISLVALGTFLLLAGRRRRAGAVQ